MDGFFLDPIFIYLSVSASLFLPMATRVIWAVFDCWGNSPPCWWSSIWEYCPYSHAFWCSCTLTPYGHFQLLIISGELSRFMRIMTSKPLLLPLPLFQIWGFIRISSQNSPGKYSNIVPSVPRRNKLIFSISFPSFSLNATCLLFMIFFLHFGCFG